MHKDLFTTTRFKDDNGEDIPPASAYLWTHFSWEYYRAISNSRLRYRRKFGHGYASMHYAHYAHMYKQYYRINVRHDSIRTAAYQAFLIEESLKNS